jgi:hypothetical protein
MISSNRLTVGALYRKGVIIVKVYTKQQEQACKIFMREFIAFLRRLEALDQQEAQEELARKNRFRRLTFRKPLLSL